VKTTKNKKYFLTTHYFSVTNIIIISYTEII
jgi:hypothetical protein